MFCVPSCCGEAKINASLPISTNPLIAELLPITARLETRDSCWSALGPWRPTLLLRLQKALWTVPFARAATTRPSRPHNSSIPPSIVWRAELVLKVYVFAYKWCMYIMCFLPLAVSAAKTSMHRSVEWKCFRERHKELYDSLLLKCALGGQNALIAFLTTHAREESCFTFSTRACYKHLQSQEEKRC